jgi:hypothetical protein
VAAIDSNGSGVDGSSDGGNCDSNDGSGDEGESNGGNGAVAAMATAMEAARATGKAA